jgi:hypothetical protein
MYAEWKAGRRPDLRVIEAAGTFGANDLHFEGERRFDRYTAGLDEALGAWMEGDGLDRPVASWFTFKVAKASVAADTVERLVRTAGRSYTGADVGRSRRAVWLGGRLLEEEAASDGRVRLAWSYRNRLHRIVLPTARARALAAALAAADPGTAPAGAAPGAMDDLLAALDAADAGTGGPFAATREFRTLRRAGLVAV